MLELVIKPLVQSNVLDSFKFSDDREQTLLKVDMEKDKKLIVYKTAIFR